MPIERQTGESDNEFMNRCIPHEIDKGHEQDQAVAICSTYLTSQYILNVDVRKQFIDSGKSKSIRGQY